MAETILINKESPRAVRYKELLPQVVALTEGESDLYANLANVMGALKEAFDFFWTGIYLVKGEQLVLGPFQGPVACARIHFGKGVCGSAWKQQQTLVVPDVDAFPGHIACSSASRSEIVVPVLRNGEVVAVLDIDSDQLDDFSQDDRLGLEAIAQHIATLF
jgi:GAF domain-containing protein